MVKLNFSNVKEFKPLEEGTYTFLIEDAQVKPTKSGDSNNLVVTLSVADEGDFNGNKITQYFSLKEEALWNLKLFLEIVSGQELPKDELEFDEEELAGNYIKGVVEKVMSDGKEYSNITGFLAA